MIGRIVWAAFIFLISTSWAALAPAQTSNQGAIVGTVRDPSGAVMPAVEIVVKSVDKGLLRQTISNDVGEYRMDYLVPGVYQLTGTLPGFKKAVLDGIVVTVGEARRIDLTMNVGEVTDEVVVTASAAAINTENAGLSEIIDAEKIQNLPLNGREFLGLAELSAGAESGSIRRGTVYSRGYAIGVNGARATYNNYQIDGAEVNTSDNELASSPALEAIKEFRIQTNMYSAQYGRAGGAVISVVTKSGSNSLHGSLYEYHRNKVLDALPWGYTGARSALANYLYNQFGASLGGPIRKNKTFFFGTAEFFRQKRPGTMRSGFAPNDLERSGDFSQTINPYSRRLVELTDPYTKQVIPGAKLPASLINPIGRRIMDEMWPKPNYSGDPFLNLRMFLGGTFNQNKYLGRVDHSFSPRDVLFGSFDANDYNTINRGWNEYADTIAYQHARTASITETHTFSPRLVNDLKGTFLFYNSRSGPLKADKNYGKEFGISDRLHKANGFPSFYMYSTASIQIGGETTTQTQNKTLYLRDNLAWMRGRHTIIFGGDWRRQTHDYKSFAGFCRYYIGNQEGATSTSLRNAYLVTGSTFASLLVAIPNLIDGGQGEDKLIPQVRNAVAGYIQDDWKVSDRLTLNLGVRYDRESAFHVTNGEYMTLNFANGLPRYAEGAPAAKLQILRFVYETGGPNYAFAPNNRDFAPRVGFAWRPFRDSMFVLRGGYGLIYNSETASNTTWGSYVTPFAGRTGYIYPKDATRWPDRQEHIRPLEQEPYGIDYVATASPGTGFIVTSPYYPMGYLQHWNLTVGKDIGRAMVGEIAYVASRGVNLNSSTTLTEYDNALQLKLNTANPAWAGNKGMKAKGFNSAYHSMQIRVRREHRNGFSYLAQYTWSRAMADASEDSANEHTLNTVILTPEGVQTYFRRTWTQANFDVRQRLALSGNYEMPFGRGKALGSNWHPIVNGVLGGWRANWIWTVQGGYPWTVTNGALISTRPDRVCNGNLPRGQRTADRWFDISCFPIHPPTSYINPATGLPATYTANGNAGANTIIGPGTNNWDLGFQKFFNVFSRERKIELRAEFFNAMNHPRLQGPSVQYFYNQPDGAKIMRAGNQRQIQIALRFTF